MKEKLLPTQQIPVKKISLRQYDYLNESYLSRLFFYWAYKIISMSQKIPIKVEILWSSEKTKNGYHPINAYELQTEVTLIGDPNLSLIK